ncbi:TPA: Lar family restriction alleviation protein [Providencia alcalifaciens]
MNELKKCPFCGGEAYIQDWSMMERSRYKVACNQCDVETPIYETEHEAIEAWNRRANSE